MAKRRMFSLDVTDTDKFINMPLKSRYLYYELGIRADDDGFIGAPMKITKMVGCTKKDLSILIEYGFVLEFKNGVIVITEWKLNNAIRKDMYKPTIYTKEFGELTLIDDKYKFKKDDGNVTPNVTDNVTYCVTSNVTLGKDSIGQYSTGQESVGESKAYQPTTSPTFSEPSVSVSSPSLLCGTFGNVSLTQQQLDWLANKYPDDYMGKIDHLSEYMYDTGKTYKDHFRKIRDWAEQDEKKKKNLGKTGEVEGQGYDLESESKRPIPPKPDNVDMTDEEWKIHIEKLRE